MSENTSKFVKRFIEQSNQSIFLTGKAGTGKTTLLNEIIQNTTKNAIVLAPTGIAALNAGGVTIHSFFQLPLASFIPSFEYVDHSNSFIKFENKSSLNKHFKMHQRKKKLIKSLELIIIDEVSMLRADILDEIDWVLRNIRKKNSPYGGIQMCFIGDLFQLPPVVKNEEWQVLKNFYKGIFFFEAMVIKEIPPLFLELNQIFRQEDPIFIELLNRLRSNNMKQKDIDTLNQYYHKNNKENTQQGYITLTTHNYKAQHLNNLELNRLQEKELIYTAKITGDFPESIYPLEIELRLKKGAQVMFVKNDISGQKLFYNGKIGHIYSLSQEEIIVYVPDDNQYIELEHYEWENIRYDLNETTKEIEEKTIGTFVQYPIKLAWAITIHKSQGLTFERAIMDLKETFASGQAYVALSRLRNINGLKLLSPVNLNELQLDYDIPDFSSNKLNDVELETLLEIKSKQFILKKINENYSWENCQKQIFYLLNKIEVETKQSETSFFLQFKEKYLESWKNLIEPSERFLKQISKIFNQEKLDKTFLLQRISAAHQYYLSLIKPNLYIFLFQFELIKNLKSSKSLKNEYILFEEYLDDLFYMFFKNNLIISKYCLQDEKNDNLSLENSDYVDYKSDIITQMKEDFIQQKNEIKGLKIEILEKTEEKKIKKPNSLERTLELYLQNKTVEQIAEERLMAVSTINDHFKSLILSGKVDIKDLINEEKLKGLKEIYPLINDYSTLSEVKEKVGDSFSWDELKWYRAHLIRSLDLIEKSNSEIV
ncbi:MAG: AAA family ATPase [Flavobacteriia bacterium]|nr:AAA family ATPase [Flavobacteriia bacterium]